MLTMESKTICVIRCVPTFFLLSYYTRDVIVHRYSFKKYGLHKTIIGGWEVNKTIISVIRFKT